MPPGGYTFEDVDVRIADDDLLAELNAFNNAQAAEARPEDPPTPLAAFLAGVRSNPDFVDIWIFVARAGDGSVSATAQGVVVRTGDNEHVLRAGINVDRAHRREGIGTALLARLAEVAEKETRRLIIGRTTDRVPAGAAFARQLGAEEALTQHTNRLGLTAVDRGLVRSWIAQAPGRAPAYELMTLDGTWPDEEAQALVDIVTVMNTAPHDALDVEDQQLTVDQWRQQERAMEAVGMEHWTIVARERATGFIVGLTDVIWDPSRPQVVSQNMTVVHPEHRGHGLGKWLKAVMLERILAEPRDQEFVHTGNADSNAAMLAINRQLGFRPYIAHSTWQVSLETVRAYLESKASVIS